MGTRSTLTFRGLKPATPAASKAARASSKKSGTKPEMQLRKMLWSLGLRYRVNVAYLPGRPDIVFPRPRVIVFCDGDFWHGRDLDARLAKLKRGNNSPYWMEKLKRNVARDRRNTAALAALGWVVLRFWETDITRDVEGIAASISATVWARRIGDR